jgi:hypothetical protein
MLEKATMTSAADAKEKRVKDAASAWLQYHSDKLAADANTERLRALRLARDASAKATASAKAATGKRLSRKSSKRHED